MCADGEFFNRHFPHNVSRLFESRHTETLTHTRVHTHTPTHTHTHVSLICNQCSVRQHVLLVLLAVIFVFNSGKIFRWTVSYCGSESLRNWTVVRYGRNLVDFMADFMEISGSRLLGGEMAFVLSRFFIFGCWKQLENGWKQLKNVGSGEFCLFPCERKLWRRNYPSSPLRFWTCFNVAKSIYRFYGRVGGFKSVAIS